MSRLSILLVLMFVTAVSAACATPSPDTQATRTTQGALETIGFTTELVDGEGVALRLDNGSSRAIGANLCTARLQVEGEEGWQPSDAALDADCVDEHAVINPGAHRTASFRIGELAQGTYRFAMSIEIPMGLGFEEIASAPFTVPGTTQEVEERIEGVETEETEETEETDTPADEDAIDE